MIEINSSNQGTMTRCLQKSYWDLLPKDLIIKIYEYDNTYKEYMTNKVLEEIWKKAWFKWKDTCKCINTIAAINHLFWKWGITDFQSSIYWYKKNYFPNNIFIDNY